MGVYRLGLFSLCVVTVRAELDHAGLFGCICSMVSSSLSVGRIYQLRHSTSREVTS